MDAKKGRARNPRRVAAERSESMRTSSRAAEDVADRGREVVERQGEQARETARIAGQAGEEMSANAAAVADELTRSSTALTSGIHDVGLAWAEYAQGAMKEGMTATQSLLRCRSFGEAMQIQSTYFKNSLDMLLDASAQISDLSVRMFTETAQRMVPRSGDLARPPSHP